MTMLGRNPLFDFMSTSSFSLTMAGSTGISPFLTLLLLGLAEILKPNGLRMGETMETILASWWSFLVLGLLTTAEVLSKCTPALDDIVDSVEVFVAPALSTIASLAILGIFTAATGVKEVSETQIGTDGIRYAPPGNLNSSGPGRGFLTFIKVVLVVAGMVLSLLIHYFKRSIRLSSLTCSAGCRQPCIVLLEILVVVCVVYYSVVSPLFDIMACIVMFSGGAYVIHLKFREGCQKDESDGVIGDEHATETTGDATNNDGASADSGASSADVENNLVQRTASSEPEATAALVGDDPTSTQDATSATPIAGTNSLPPPISPLEAKPDVEAIDIDTDFASKEMPSEACPDHEELG